LPSAFLFQIFRSQAFCSKELIKKITNNYETHSRIDAICAIESRGFFLGIIMAQKLRVPLFPVRKKGSLHSAVRSYSYNLEYGSSTLEVQTGIIQPHWNVIVHDDILATGGTAVAAAELIKMEGGNVFGFAFMDALEGLDGVKHLESYSKPIVTI
jgi:adenine phosphoribosyltransferase